MALMLDCSEGDQLVIDSGRIIVAFRRKSGGRTRVAIEADKGVNIEKIAQSDNRNNRGCKQGLTKR